MICGRNAAGRRRWNGPTKSAHRAALCPVSIRSERTRTPSGPPISTESRTAPVRISSPRSPPEQPPNRPPAAPDSITPPEAVKKSGSKNPRHVTIVSMACHYCSAYHYCHGMRHMWHAAIAPEPRRAVHFAFLARMWSLRGAAPTQKNKQHAEQVTSVAFNNP